MANMLSNYTEDKGLYLSWDRLKTSEDVDHYRIFRSSHIDGTYEEIDYGNDQEFIEYPQDEFIDVNGDINNYYIVKEMNSLDEVVAEHPPVWGEDFLLRASLGYELDPWLRVPVYEEEPIFVNDERTIARVAAWNYWCYWPRPELYISVPSNSGDRSSTMIIPQSGVKNLITIKDENNNPIVEYPDLKWHPDYNGHIYFTDGEGKPVSISWQDRIRINYNFRAFSAGNMNDALFLAAAGIVAQHGVSKSGRIPSYGVIGDIPRRWDPAVVFGASYILIRRLMIMLTQRERRLVFLDPNDPQATNPFNDLNTILGSYKEQYEDLKEKIATEKYPTIGIVSVQEYQLPGSRSRMFRMAWKGS